MLGTSAPGLPGPRSRLSGAGRGCRRSPLGAVEGGGGGATPGPGPWRAGGGQGPRQRRDPARGKRGGGSAQAGWLAGRACAQQALCAHSGATPATRAAGPQASAGGARPMAGAAPRGACCSRDPAGGGGAAHRGAPVGRGAPPRAGPRGDPLAHAAALPPGGRGSPDRGPGGTPPAGAGGGQRRVGPGPAGAGPSRRQDPGPPAVARPGDRGGLLVGRGQAGWGPRGPGSPLAPGGCRGRAPPGRWGAPCGPPVLSPQESHAPARPGSDTRRRGPAGAPPLPASPRPPGGARLGAPSGARLAARLVSRGGPPRCAGAPASPAAGRATAAGQGRDRAASCRWARWGWHDTRRALLQAVMARSLCNSALPHRGPAATAQAQTPRCTQPLQSVGVPP